MTTNCVLAFYTNDGLCQQVGGTLSKNIIKSSCKIANDLSSLSKMTYVGCPRDVDQTLDFYNIHSDVK